MFNRDLRVILDDSEVVSLILHAWEIINDWRLYYNECRRHSLLNYQTPFEFAAGWRNGKYEEKP
ncbi:integrase core domain-containing protein [Yersinia enterocolitica]